MGFCPLAPFAALLVVKATAAAAKAKAKANVMKVAGGLGMVAVFLQPCARVDFAMQKWVLTLLGPCRSPSLVSPLRGRGSDEGNS